MPSNSKKPSQPHQTAQSINEARVTGAWMKDLTLIRRMIGRTRTVNDPHKQLFSQRDHSKFSDFKIAAISTNLKVKDLVEKQKDGYSVWMVKDLKRRRSLRDEFIQHLEMAGKAGAKLVCFNELAYPTPVDKGDSHFQTQIKKIVKNYELFLIAGSYHDMDKCYNLCPVVVPHSHHQHEPEIHTHAKMNSAVRIFENIRIPPNRQLRYYETLYGAFTIFVCIDVYDPSLAFRLMMQNHAISREETLDIVFVPSFSPEKGPSTARACRDLSYATAALVVYMNCDANEPRHAVYLAGEELSAENDAVTCQIRELSKNLLMYEVSYDEYHRIRTKVTDEYSPVFEYLIGMKDGLRFKIAL